MCLGLVFLLTKREYFCVLETVQNNLESIYGYWQFLGSTKRPSVPLKFVG